MKIYNNLKRYLNSHYKNKKERRFTKILLNSIRYNSFDDITDDELFNLNKIIIDNYQGILSYYTNFCIRMHYICNDKYKLRYLNFPLYKIISKDKEVMIQFILVNNGLVVQYFDMIKEYFSVLFIIEYDNKFINYLEINESLKLLDEMIPKENAILKLSKEQWINLGKRNKEKLLYSMTWYFSRCNFSNVNYDEDILIIDYLKLHFNDIFFLIAIKKMKETDTDFNLVILAFRKYKNTDFYISNLVNEELALEDITEDESLNQLQKIFLLNMLIVIKYYVLIKFSDLILKVICEKNYLNDILLEINK